MTAFWRSGDPVEPLRELLRRGGVLAIPTESSYGLGVDPRNRIGVEAIYRIKGREPRKPLPVVAADLRQLADLGIDADLSILKVLSACWPGPLTAVLPRKRPIAGPEIPAAAAFQEKWRHALTLTATSANPSGGEPVLDPEGAAYLLAGEDAMVVDGGVLPGGLPSTLVAIEEAGPVVLRTGTFPVERLREVLRAAQGEDV